MEGGYTVWMGQPVILRVVAGNLRVPLRGRLVAETDSISSPANCRQLGCGYFQVHGRGSGDGYSGAGDPLAGEIR